MQTMDWVQFLRDWRKISQAGLVERIKNDPRAKGIDSPYDLSRLEAGRWLPLPEQEEVLLEKLNAPIAELRDLMRLILEGATVEEVKKYVQTL